MSRSSPVRPLFLILAALALAAVAPAVGGSDDIVREFKKYFRKYKDTPTRVEAVLALSGTESVEVVRVLIPVLKDKEAEVAQAAVRVLGGFESRPPVDQLLAELEEQSNERVQLGILAAIQTGGYSGIREATTPLLQASSWELRRRAIQALIAGDGAAAAELVAPLCEDSEVAVRCEALDGLAQLDSELVLEPSIGDLQHDAWQVRSSAIAALGRVRHRDSIEPLIERMGLEEGRLVADIGEALAELTGRNFRDRVDGWQNFWSIYRDKFVMPTDEELALLRKKQAESAAIYQPPPGAVSFLGVTSPSRSILFIIDVSGSMEQEVVERDRFADGSYPSFQRIDIVKTELVRTVERLESYVRFNILSFATEVDPWKKSLVSANVLNKSSAASWTQRLEAIGGSSKEDLAAVGLTGAANLEAGKTNSFAALMEGLGVEDSSQAGEDYEISVDTVFFLSDGRPSHGKYVDTDDILREVNAVNDLRKVVIHTIAIGEFEKDFMRRLAEDNGGVFVDLGR